MNQIFASSLGNDLNGESLNHRIEFLQDLKQHLESMNMPPAMKVLWEETKSEKG